VVGVNVVTSQLASFHEIPMKYHQIHLRGKSTILRSGSLTLETVLGVISYVGIVKNNVH